MRTSVARLYVHRPRVVLSNYAATTTSSLVKPKAESLAKVLPFVIVNQLLTKLFQLRRATY